VASALASLSAPLRVLHVITGLEMGGAEGTLATSRENHGLQHHIVSLKSGGYHAAKLRAAGVAVNALGPTPSRPNPRALIALARLSRRIAPATLRSFVIVVRMKWLLLAAGPESASC
jgi:hypothetical protein